VAALHQSLRFFVDSAPVILLAPVFYWLAGLLLARAAGKLEWATLWGIGLMGLVGEVAGIAGIPARAATMAVAACAIAGAVFSIMSGGRRNHAVDWAGEIRPNLESYLISLLAVSVVPFAIPGPWGGDWLYALDSGRYIADGRSFYPELLARPPLFGAASIPVCLFGGPLASFQVFCAVASAGLLQVARTLVPAAGRSRQLWLLGGSVFFLHITVNAWPKFLAASFIIAAWVSGGEPGRRKVWITGTLTGLSLATHQSSALFVPFVLARILGGSPTLGKFTWKAAQVLAVAAIVCAPWEIYTLLTYGLAAKVQANPSVSQRIAGVPTWLNGILVGVSTFVPWGPLEALRHSAAVESPFSPARIQREIYWLVTSIFDSLAGSLAGILVPWLVVFRFRQLRAGILELWDAIPVAGRFALAISLVGQCLLNPFYGEDGSLQTGWVPVGVGLVLWLMNWVSRQPQNKQSSVVQSTLVLGLIPWVIFHVALTAGLFFSARLKEQITVSEGDLQRIAKFGLTPLGLGGFPWVQLLVLIGLFALYGNPWPNPKTTSC
jgi:hypothetical protein